MGKTLIKLLNLEKWVKTDQSGERTGRGRGGEGGVKFQGVQINSFSTAARGNKAFKNLVAVVKHFCIRNTMTYRTIQLSSAHFFVQ